MLIQLLMNHPEAGVEILRRTPTWVWGLLASLLLLGAIQLRTRHIGLRRAAAPAMGLTMFSLISLGSDLSSGPWLAPGLLMWLAGGALVLVWRGPHALPPGTAHDPASGLFTLPGSALPLLTSAAIFLLKYIVGVEQAMQPGLRLDSLFALSTAAGYGALTGLFAARFVALWLMASRQDRTVNA